MTNSDFDAVGSLVQRFEEEWDPKAKKDFGPYLVGLEGEPWFAALRELIHSDMELRARNRLPIHLGDYWGPYPDLKNRRDDLIFLLHQEWKLGKAQGLDVDPAFLEKKYPELSHLVQNALLSTREIASESSWEFPANGSEPPLGGDSPLAQEPLPESIGRYRILKVLGTGNFGRVFLASDLDLGVRVALKVPRADRILQPEDMDLYRKEARTVATLEDIEGIVPVKTVGGDAQHPFFVVSKFIEGETLEDRLKQTRLDPRVAAQISASLARSLHLAHSRGVYHRDLKPANILLDSKNQPWILDFGLALREEEIGKVTWQGGTPYYMSPEQAKRQGHRVDGRTDLFSLGVILYEMLSGKRPFQGSSRAELFDQILHLEPRPLRARDDRIPRELERICLKSLSKPLRERYATGRDMADDLEAWLGGSREPAKDSSSSLGASASAGTRPQKGDSETVKSVATGLGSDSGPVPRQEPVIPKGLRSFDEHDAGFFLELLPGARGRDGLPESIRYWKTRMESPRGGFAVGLLFGPSGCGKSSLVKAGLLPRLDPTKVVPLYIEAAVGQTEARLLKGLQRFGDREESSSSLLERMIGIRQGRFPSLGGRRIVLILDQFEQWLHERNGAFEGELAAALGQCDGERLQCLLLVRDDFAMAITRFLREELETSLDFDHNYQVFDLFNKNHARKVLVELGRGYGALPPWPEEPTKEQISLIHAAVDGLAEENRVISVRLAVFAQMMRNRLWTPESLKEVGGVDGLGISFLVETFAGTGSSPEYRFHQKAVRGVLKALLPEPGMAIKGRMKSQEALIEASGYTNKLKEFDGLVRILDRELKLLTPTDPENDDRKSGNPNQTRYYQLAHDYLVPSIREWLLKKQKETAKGRAEILLEERAALWSDKPQIRYLPSLPEYLRITWHTRVRDLTSNQRRMVRQAGWFHGLRSLAAVILLGIFGFGAYEGYQRFHALKLVDTLANAEPGQIERLVKQLEPYAAWADGRLELIRETQAGTNQALAATLGLLPRHPDLATELAGHLTSVGIDRFAVVGRALRDHSSPDLKNQLWSDALSERDSFRRFRLAGALALIDGANPRWEQLGEFVANQLVKLDATQYLFFRDTIFSSVGSRLVPALANCFRNSQTPDQVRQLAAEALVIYGKDQPNELFGLLLDAPPAFYSLLEKTCLDRVDVCAPLALKEIRTPIPDNLPDEGKDTQAIQKSNAALFLLNAGREGPDLWKLCEQSSDNRVRSEIIHACSSLNVNPEILIKRLKIEKNITVKSALVLMLGSYSLDQIPKNELERLLETFLIDFETNPNSGYHSSVEWLLGRWGKFDQVKLSLKKLSKIGFIKEDNKEWFVNSLGLTMILIPKGKYWMGSPKTEQHRKVEEEIKKASIDFPFFISNTEITLDIFSQFIEETKLPWPERADLEPYLRTPSDPAGAIKWFRAAHFCNWVNEKEKISRQKWYYIPKSTIDSADGGYAEGMKIQKNNGRLGSYRLPTEVEWEYACRAATRTSRFFGNRPELLPHYATVLRSKGPDHFTPVTEKKPNDWGLFGVLGNAYEWVDDNYEDPEGEKLVGKVTPGFRILRGGAFLFLDRDARSAYRGYQEPTLAGTSFGFRVVFVPELSN